MKKTFIAAAVGAAFALPLAAQAASASVNGFGDIIYTVVDEAADGTGAGGDNPNEGKFSANAEADITAGNDRVSVRVDADLDLVTNEGDNVAGTDSARIEQAFFALKATPAVTVLGGVFNNPIGYEKEDAPDLYQVTHGQIWSILDGQTKLHGNNVAGVAVAGAMGPVSVTVGVLNDLGQADEENSYALVLGASPMNGLDIEFGYSTVDAIDYVYDLNAQYKVGGLTAAVEYLSAGEVVDSAYGLYGNYDFGNGFSATLRYDNVGYEAANTDDTTSVTVAGGYKIADNLQVNLEWRNNDDGTDDNSLAQAEFIATF